ncbi:hypothetical protein [Microbulbifer mangrovi]|uniref:hypothetical protein n=1 Tax=Microbulbifer mangrovi TaxID=927787 RepID=UPI0009904B88|nr:hypothetical protein [Microbulbifer mangrovi]
MNKPSHKIIAYIITTILLIAAGVIASYVIGVGIIGGSNFSSAPEDWAEFSTYFNGMLSPILAGVAAAVAFISINHQLSAHKQDSTQNEKISNYLNHIKLLQNMIEKQWLTITKVTKSDWEHEPFYAINKKNIKSNLLKNVYLSPEVNNLSNLFQDLVEAVQWYTQLHKSKIEFNSKDFVRSEWSHFSRSLIREHDKKMRYCYEYCNWLIEEPCAQTKKYQTQALSFRQFYENLCSNGTIQTP